MPERHALALARRTDAFKRRTRDVHARETSLLLRPGVYPLFPRLRSRIALPITILGLIAGACYAEFGVRVPHTTGSAYMYSYVTVGELIAFIIGWNMVLEYLIGTSACACALSACLDALANGAVSGAIANSVGTIFGEYPYRISRLSRRSLRN